MIKTLFFSMTLFVGLLPFTSSGRTTDTINRLNKFGEREGWWILSSENNPIRSGKGTKAKEGYYINGRRNGVWISYYEDGQSPRLIGEYADNRPSGTYFRFDRKGELQRASAVPKRISVQHSVETTNPLFSCKMFFSEREMVAGQVFFSRSIFKKDLAFQFWVESSMQAVKSETKLVDYTWLNANYTNILMTYTAIRTPKKMRVAEPKKLVAEVKPKVSEKVSQAREKNYYYPPAIRQPRVARGMTFQPNGLNKLYTESSEIWIDGHFVNGQLQTGKVFVYDRDGVLLKVRVYKDGVYESDGVL